jgi:hypothetical protein
MNQQHQKRLHHKKYFRENPIMKKVLIDESILNSVKMYIDMSNHHTKKLTISKKKQSCKENIFARISHHENFFD